MSSMSAGVRKTPSLDTPSTASSHSQQQVVEAGFDDSDDGVSDVKTPFRVSTKHP